MKFRGIGNYAIPWSWKLCNSVKLEIIGTEINEIIIIAV
jgi:hypothetical protein